MVTNRKMMIVCMCLSLSLVNRKDEYVCVCEKDIRVRLQG